MLCSRFFGEDAGKSQSLPLKQLCDAEETVGEDTEKSWN